MNDHPLAFGGRGSGRMVPFNSDASVREVASTMSAFGITPGKLPQNWLDRDSRLAPLSMEVEEMKAYRQSGGSSLKLPGSIQMMRRCPEDIPGSRASTIAEHMSSLERGDRLREPVEPSSSWCFPCYLCDCWCPLADRCIPAPFRVIQGWTHLLLITSMLSSLWLFCWSIYRLYRYFHSTDDVDKRSLPETLLGIPLAFCCLVYISKQTQQFDEDLKVKKEQVERQRLELIDDFRETLSSMDCFLCETTQTSLGFAERGFETKRRDFQRFLERIQVTYSDERLLTHCEYSQLMAQLRRFCLCWFKVFGECSIDPVHAPRSIATPAELDACPTVPDLADLCLKRLKAAEVKFISTQKEQDSKLCDDTRGVFRKITAIGTALSSYAWSFSETEQTCCCQGISWLSCSCSKPEIDEVVKDSMLTVGYPKVCTCCCCFHIVFLSREHIGLLFAFFLYAVMLYLELHADMFDPKMAHKHYSLCPLLIIEFCLFVVLVRFEDIDIVQQLQRECTSLIKEKARVEDQHQRMKEFWYQAQALTDLWLYRTVPRLNLYSEVQGFLDGLPMHELVSHLECTNQNLEDFERRLPEIEAWRADGTLSEASKKEFREVISNVCHQKCLDTCLSELARTSLPWTNAALAGSKRAPKPPPQHFVAGAGQGLGMQPMGSQQSSASRGGVGKVQSIGVRSSPSASARQFLRRADDHAAL